MLEMTPSGGIWSSFTPLADTVRLWRRKLFVRAVQKIVPDLTAGDIEYAEGFVPCNVGLRARTERLLP